MFNTKILFLVLFILASKAFSQCEAVGNTISSTNENNFGAWVVANPIVLNQAMTVTGVAVYEGTTGTPSTVVGGFYNGSVSLLGYGMAPNTLLASTAATSVMNGWVTLSFTGGATVVPAGAYQVAYQDNVEKYFFSNTSPSSYGSYGQYGAYTLYNNTYTGSMPSSIASLTQSGSNNYTMYCVNAQACTAAPGALPTPSLSNATSQVALWIGTSITNGFGANNKTQLSGTSFAALCTKDLTAYVKPTTMVNAGVAGALSLNVGLALQADMSVSCSGHYINYITGDLIANDIVIANGDQSATTVMITGNETVWQAWADTNIFYPISVSPYLAPKCVVSFMGQYPIPDCTEWSGGSQGLNWPGESYAVSIYNSGVSALCAKYGFNYVNVSSMNPAWMYVGDGDYIHPGNQAHFWIHEFFSQLFVPGLQWKNPNEYNF